MRKALILFYLLCLCGDLSAVYYERLVDRITSKFTKELKAKKIHLSGYGGRMMDDVEEIVLLFDTTNHVAIEEARELFVNIGEEYLKRINADTRLRPFLRNYPFTIDNMDLSLSFRDKKRHFQTNLALVFYNHRSKRIFYESYDPAKEKFHLIYEEPYEEAVRLVHEGKR